MKRLLISLFAVALISTPAFAATWVAADRVAEVGAKILEKNGLPKTTTFKVVNGEADNSDVATTNVIYISSTDLSYTGNDNEVAAVIGTEIGHIINGKSTKTKLRNLAKAAIASKLSEENIVNKQSFKDNKGDNSSMLNIKRERNNDSALEDFKTTNKKPKTDKKSEKKFQRGKV